jgi:hypothetical protein
MNHLLALMLLALAFLATNRSPAAEDGAFPEVSPVAAKARRIVNEALASERPEDWRRAIDQLKDLLPAASPIVERVLQPAPQSEESVAATSLATALQEVGEMLAFTPRHEAQLPEGFPSYTPVGLIEVKTYPRSRRAVAGQFWTLFRHISSNDIAMTTPVRMEYEVPANGRPRQQSMAFFYGSTQIGKSGADGRVKVVDEQPLVVVALGVRGGTSERVIRDGHARLERWVNGQHEYVIDGPLRVMGYNSPMVPRGKQFAEIQLPLRKVDAEPSPSDSPSAPAGVPVAE